MARSSRYPRIVPQLPKGDELFELLVVDRHLSALSEKLRVLKYITPVNSREVRDAYLSGKSGGSQPSGPDFMYRNEEDDLDAAKRELFAVPINSDSVVGQIYRRKRDELADVLTMLQARGTTEFRERSKLLYGTTTREELDAVEGWLKLAPDPPQDRTINAREAAQQLRQRLSQAKLFADVRIRHNLGSTAAAGETSIGVRSDATFSPAELERIFVHEAETHILRFRNGERQPFRALFYHGFPRHGDGAGNYMYTEEGLATFQEEVTGTLSNDRRRTLAGRALSVYLMDTEGLGFDEVFLALRDEHKFDADEAFNITERAFRGGGYTKDHIYHTGYIRVREAVLDDGLDWNLLLSGKVGLGWMHLLEHLDGNGEGAGTGVLHRPRFLPTWLRKLQRLRSEQDGGAGDSESDDDDSTSVNDRPIRITADDLTLLRHADGAA